MSLELAGHCALPDPTAESAASLMVDAVRFCLPDQAADLWQRLKVAQSAATHFEDSERLVTEIRIAALLLMWRVGNGELSIVLGPPSSAGARIPRMVKENHPEPELYDAIVDELHAFLAARHQAPGWSFIVDTVGVAVGDPHTLWRKRDREQDRAFDEHMARRQRDRDDVSLLQREQEIQAVIEDVVAFVLRAPADADGKNLCDLIFSALQAEGMEDMPTEIATFWAAHRIQRERWKSKTPVLFMGDQARVEPLRTCEQLRSFVATDLADAKVAVNRQRGLQVLLASLGADADLIPAFVMRQLREVMSA